VAGIARRIATFARSGQPTDPHAAATWHPRESYLLVVVCLTCLAWAARQETGGWTHSISGAAQHGFRQTQTALSTVYLARGAPVLAYETPVIGPP
jgi:hypothetical protein